MNRKSLKFLKALIGDLREALQADYWEGIRKRLFAVKQVLQGRPVSDVAGSMKIRAATILRWVETAKQSGCAGLIGPDASNRILRSKIKQDAREARRKTQHQLRNASLRPHARLLIKLASTEKDKELKAKLRALALVASGMTYASAAAHVGVIPATVSRWVKVFQQDGFEALRSKSPRAPKRSGKSIG